MAFRRSIRSAAGIGAALLVLLAAPALGMAPQTFIDPVGDNCRDYTGNTITGNHCGPDISRVTFTAPGDGNLHVDIAYASLPASTSPEIPTQIPEFVDIGIYPLAATTPNLFATTDTYRVAQTSPGEWTLSSISGGLKVIGTATAVPSGFGIEILVPLSPLSLPWTHRYAVNAGSAGETIPDHPDIAPNSGLYDLPADAPPPPPPPPPLPQISALTGIASTQRSKAISGTVTINVPGDLTVEALMPGARSKLASIAKMTKRGVAAGRVSFRVALPAKTRRKLAGRRTRVTLRLTLKPQLGASITQTRVITLRVPR